MPKKTYKKKSFPKKSYEEIQAEIKTFSDEAVKDIESYVAPKAKPEDLLEYADFMRQFHKYSFHNVAMIHSQYPGALAVGSAKKFMDAGFYVRKGEKAIRIFAPVTSKYFIDRAGKSKPISQATAEEKKLIKEDKLKTRTANHFKLVPVFDIKQTLATKEDLPKIFPDTTHGEVLLGGIDVVAYRQSLESVSSKMGVPIFESRLMKDGSQLGNAGGAFVQRTDGEDPHIILNPNISKEEQISVLLHEMAHARLHSIEQVKNRPGIDVPTKEIEAELTNYIVSKHYGIDTSADTIPYIATWTNNGSSLEDKRESLRYVHEASSSLIKEIDLVLEPHLTQEQSKEQEVEDKVQEESVAYEKEKKLTFEQRIEKAKSASIIEVASMAGLELQRDSQNQYRDVNNHSMVFTANKNVFFENNGQFGGDPIEFVQKVVGIENFKEAIDYINKGDLSTVTVSNKKEKFVYDKSREVIDFSKAKDYLVRKRKINEGIIDTLHKKGLIKQDNRNNVLFLWSDKGKAVGCSEQGTVHTDKTKRNNWKKIQANSAGDRGFNIKNGLPKNLKFFESPIDLLSYATINRKQLADTLLVSMDGFNKATVYSYMSEAREETKHGIESISLCVDNDQAGKEFVKSFENLTLKQFIDADSEKGEGKNIDILGELPTPPKERKGESWDWNNELVYQVETRKKEREKEKKSRDKESGSLELA